MRRTSIVAAAVVALFVLLPASPASAHASFVGAPSGYPTNSQQSLTINVPHERDDTTYNVDVVVAMPSGWTPLSCESKPTWTCSLGTVDNRPVVRFTKASGAPVGEDETFMFAVQTASTVGSFAFPTVQTYNTTEVVRWIGAAGTSNPAPMLSTLAGGTAPQSTPPTTNPDAPPPTIVAPPPTTVATTGAPSTTVATSTTAATVTTTTIAGAATTSASSITTTTINGTVDGDDDGGGTTTAGLAALIVIGAAGGWLVSRRYSQSRRRNSA